MKAENVIVGETLCGPCKKRRASALTEMAQLDQELGLVVEPERKTATVWFNVYPRGEMSEPYATKEHAGSEAGPGREACIEVPITWTKGEGLGE